MASKKLEKEDMYVGAYLTHKRTRAQHRVGLADAKHGPTGRYLYYPVLASYPSGKRMAYGPLSAIRESYRKPDAK